MRTSIWDSVNPLSSLEKPLETQYHLLPRSVSDTICHSMFNFVIDSFSFSSFFGWTVIIAGRTQDTYGRDYTRLEFYRLMFLDVLLALRRLIRFVIDSTSLRSILCFLILQKIEQHDILFGPIFDYLSYLCKFIARVPIMQL